jgi:hypothetical protein
VVLVVAAMPAGGAGPAKPADDDVRSANLRLVGATGDNRPVVTFAEAFFTDAAFQGDYAYQGTWNGGFRIVDISRPQKPKAVAEVDCGTFQGDIGVYKNLVFRSIDTPIAATTPEGTCDAAPAASGFEGIQIFEVRKGEAGERGRPRGRGGDRLRLPHAHRRPGPEAEPRASVRLGERDRAAVRQRPDLGSRVRVGRRQVPDRRGAPGRPRGR